MSRRCRFHTLDVFTDERFFGNPLAVVLDAEALEPTAMQAVAAEFNLSETVFVTAVDEVAARAAIRIFTPRAELPFAGHPTVGTALLLARNGLCRRQEGGISLTLDEQAGPVPVTLTLEGEAPVTARFTAPGEPRLDPPIDPALVAPALDLATADLAHLAPRRAGYGVGFLMAELASLDALARARCLELPPVLLEAGLEHGAYLFTRATADGTIRARLFAPALGIAEDPATGAAAAGLAALLAGTDPSPDLDAAWRIVQGVEMGRRSTIDITATKRAGRVTAVTVEGGAVPVSEGWLTI